MDIHALQTLLRPDAYPHPTRQILLRETHASWILLTGEFAYKIKKPVNFGFLDFSTPEKRLHCCHEEIRLNRRLCPQIYLDVVRIRQRAAGGLYIAEVIGQDPRGTEPSQECVEVAVRMRQFDAEATLDSWLTQHAPDAFTLTTLGYRIAAFHADATRATPDSPWGSPQAVISPVEENFHQIQPLPEAVTCQHTLENLQQQASKQAHDLTTLFLQRKQSGFVRELHGDLHTGNIAQIDNAWTPFDCIEFNPQLRWIDTASDIAFLLMDLEQRGHADAATLIRNAWLEYNGDYESLALLDFYRGYRAMVRAKVCMLRLQQTPATTPQYDALQKEFAHYLDYCQRLPAKKPPFLVLMSGVSGSGKSTVARAIAATTGAVHLRSDVTRKRLCGLTPLQSSAGSGNIYTPTISARTFEVLLQEAETTLLSGFAAIVDATFLREAHRAPFLALAQQRGIPLLIVCCRASPEELEKRIRKRQAQAQDASEADDSIMRLQMSSQEAFTLQEQSHCIDAETVLQQTDFYALLRPQAG